MATNIPQSIDYTSRDFYSLRDDLITRVKDRLAAAGKTWNGTDPSDFGVAILEAFAHVGDVTSYYIDRVANEGYLSTATQRQSLLNLAELYGYTPSGYRRASVELSFSNPDTENIVIIPEGTQVGVDIVSTNGTYSSVTKVIFTLDSEVLIPAAEDETTAGTATGLAFHGYNVSSLATNAADPLDPIDFPGEILGSSNGFAEQAFVLSSNRVADGTVDPCTSAAAEKVFELTPVQRIVSRFLHPSTPYHSMLLFHGVGVGKTCSAVTIAENFLEGWWRDLEETLTTDKHVDAASIHRIMA
jgi:hypothetical protein